jgi:hypothetical protein
MSIAMEAMDTTKIVRQQSGVGAAFVNGASMPNESRDEDSPIPAGGTRGLYANYFQVGHNACEILIDFGQAFADTDQEYFHTRIVTSPAYAKELLKVLQEALREYEKQYGAIPFPGD